MSLIILIDPKNPRPLYLQIIDEIRRALVRGDVEGGFCLPSVRQLSSHLKVNPSTVQQAYQEMEREGLVFVQRGKGTYLSPARSLGRETEKVARQVAEEAIRNAHRSGLTKEDLVAAILALGDDRLRPMAAFPTSLKGHDQ